VKALNKNTVIIAAHEVCRPVQEQFVGGVRQLSDVALPDKIASLYLDLVEEWRLRPLNGFCYGPMLLDDGQIELPEGYDKTSGLWCTQTPIEKIPSAPSRSDAQAALQRLRANFKTFPFADAAIRRNHAQTLVEGIAGAGKTSVALGRLKFFANFSTGEREYYGLQNASDKDFEPVGMMGFVLSHSLKR
jgi:hypothetical protein